ncbi:MAG: FAD-dependent oxidoreductase [Candidatus Glassbacteria bacterium]|nr:FAD-dependent oxidoreductase [Candidatus Glassbacteria bacterium]
MSKTHNRRDFFQLALGGGTAAGLLAGTLASPSYAQLKRDGAAAIRQADEAKLMADVVIVGGGPSGVTAALAAARNGSSVVLVQNRPVLGGNSSSEVRMHIVGANNNLPDARETGIIEELRLENQVRNPQRSASMWDLLLWEKTWYHPRITLLLNTVMDSCRTDSGLIRSISCYQMTTQTRFEIEGALFADCTGDGTLGYLAGNPWRQGQEGKAEYGESMAPDEPTPYTMGSSLLFQGRDMGRPVPFIAPDWAHKYPTHESLGRNPGSPEYGYWWIEWGGMLDTIKDDDRIREELLKVLLGVWDHLKNHGDHGAGNWALDWFGFLPARRENRRLLGAYILRQDDLTSGRVFDDEVAFGGWPIDHHFPEGIDYKGSDFWFSNKLDDLYSIPLRSLHSATLRNLFIGGRCLSATHLALASTRVMATCAVIGQGIGTAAAHCSAMGRLPGELGKDDIEQIKQTLLRDDAYLLGTPNRDPDDLARKAKAGAASSLPVFGPENVLDGTARSRHGSGHQWRSRSLDPDDCRLELDFGEPVSLSRVHLCFDTGLSRAMTLTHQDSYHETMIEGPQPETVKDYVLEAHVDGTWCTVAVVAGNYQRLLVHEFSPLPVTKLRLNVLATHGVNQARVFEIRAYA